MEARNSIVMKDSRIISVNSIIVAFFAEIQTFNLILSRIFPSSAGNILSQLYFVGIVPLLLLSVFLWKGNKKIDLWSIIIALSILAAYKLSPKFAGGGGFSSVLFYTFAIVPLLIPQISRINAKIFVMALMILPSFSIFFLSTVFTFTLYSTIGMDMSYAYVCPIIAALIYIMKYWKEDSGLIKYIMIVVFMINCVFFVYMIFSGSRGPSLSVILCAFFLWTTSIKNKGYGIQIKSVKTLFFFGILVLVVANFSFIIKFLLSIAGSYGIESGTLVKMIGLLEDGNLVDGRDVINDITLKKIWESPIVGYGLGCSPSIIGTAYPHNFVLQFLLDGGIILASVILIPIIVHLVKWWKRCTNEDYIIITLLFFTAVVGAFFSLETWTNLRLWLCFGFILSNNMGFNKRHAKGNIRYSNL